MVNSIKIILDTGATDELLFNTYFLRLLSREVKNEGAASVEDVISHIHDTLDQWNKFGALEATSTNIYSGLDSICVALVPIYKCGLNAAKELAGLDEDATTAVAESSLKHITIEGIVAITNALVECIFPKGLPKENKKKGAGGK